MMLQDLVFTLGQNRQGQQTSKIGPSFTLRRVEVPSEGLQKTALWNQWYWKVAHMDFLGSQNKMWFVSFILFLNWPPVASMYGIFTYIWLIFMVNVGKYTIHGCYGFVGFWLKHIDLSFLKRRRKSRTDRGTHRSTWTSRSLVHGDEYLQWWLGFRPPGKDHHDSIGLYWENIVYTVYEYILPINGWNIFNYICQLIEIVN